MSIVLAHPLPGSTLSDPYGYRGAIPSIGVPAQLHNGQDFAANAGMSIKAAHDGVVIWSGWDNIGGGNGVQIQDKSGFSTLYFHMLKSAYAAVGAKVMRGDTVGLVGATGAATGNHLHFMLRVNGKDVDPMPHIVKEKPSPPVVARDESEDMADPIYVTVNAKTDGYWAVNPITGKRRMVPSGEWTALRKAESVVGKLALVEITKAQLDQIPKQ